MNKKRRLFRKVYIQLFFFTIEVIYETIKIMVEILNERGSGGRNKRGSSGSRTRIQRIRLISLYYQVGNPPKSKD